MLRIRKAAHQQAQAKTELCAQGRVGNIVVLGGVFPVIAGLVHRLGIQPQRQGHCLPDLHGRQCQPKLPIHRQVSHAVQSTRVVTVEALLRRHSKSIAEFNQNTTAACLEIF